MTLARFIYDWFGVGNNGQANTAYSFWSGVGSCLTYIAVLGAAWRHLNCHSQGCWRLAKHPVDGTPYKVCAKHHPTIPNRITAAHIHDAHRDAQV